MPIVCSVYIFGIWSNLVVTIITLIGKSDERKLIGEQFDAIKKAEKMNHIYGRGYTCESEMSSDLGEMIGLGRGAHSSRLTSTHESNMSTLVPIATPLHYPNV